MNKYDWDNVLAGICLIGLLAGFVWLATGVWL